jgi:hypothetical protein
METGESKIPKLDRDFTVEPHVLTEVDHTHPTATKLPNDAVMRGSLADHWRNLTSKEDQFDESRADGGNLGRSFAISPTTGF